MSLRVVSHVVVIPSFFFPPGALLMSSRIRPTRWSSISLAAAAFALAACADSPSTAPARSAEPATALDQISFENPRHEMPTQAQAAQNAKEAAGGGGSGSGIYYHGGPVLQAGTNVVAVYWANAAIYSGGPTPGTVGAGSQDGSLVGYFLANLGGSPYFNINSTYT